MKVLSLDKLATIEGGSHLCGTYCPLALLVKITGYKTGSWFAIAAGLALKAVLCTPCPPPPG